MDIKDANLLLSRVKLLCRRNRVFMRATLPERGRAEISTGCPVTAQGIKIALAKAQKLESDLLLERFNPSDWFKSETAIAESKTIEQICNEFEKSHWQRVQKTGDRIPCFKTDYLEPFKYLPPDECLNANTLMDIVVKFEAGTRSRIRFHHAFDRLAKFAGLKMPAEWAELQKGYKPSRDRVIPTDGQILADWQNLTGRWQWAFGILACYGLRNHELFRLNFDQFPVLQVLKGKTGYRVVYPLHKNWVSQMNLQDIKMPLVNLERCNRALGSGVSTRFNRLKLDYSPLSLRDAYAIRGAVLGVSPAIISKWMGHSLDTHYKHYLRWLDKDGFDKAWDSIGEQLVNTQS